MITVIICLWRKWCIKNGSWGYRHSRGWRFELSFSKVQGSCLTKAPFGEILLYHACESLKGREILAMVDSILSVSSQSHSKNFPVDTYHRVTAQGLWLSEDCRVMTWLRGENLFGTLLEELDSRVESETGTLSREGRKFRNEMEMEREDFDVLVFDASLDDSETTPWMK